MSAILKIYKLVEHSRYIRYDLLVISVNLHRRPLLPFPPTSGDLCADITMDNPEMTELYDLFSVYKYELWLITFLLTMLVYNGDSYKKGIKLQRNDLTFLYRLQDSLVSGSAKGLLCSAFFLKRKVQLSIYDLINY